MKTCEKMVIIIPTYNETAVIAQTIHALENILTTVPHVATAILVFDSHSSDGTPVIIQQLQQQYPNLYLATEPEKTGLGSAYIQAMHYAITQLQADIVVEYDADGSHQPQFILAMLNQLQQGYDVVIGSRYIAGGSIAADCNIYRKMLSIVGNKVAQLFLTSQYKDFTSGFRMTRVSALQHIDLNQLLSKQYAYKIHLLWALHQQGAKIIELPIAFIDRKQGYSKFPPNNTMDSLRTVITLWWRKK